MPATEADRDWVRSLNRAAYHEVVTRQFGRWDEEDQTHRFEHKWRQHAYRIICCDGERVGALWTTEWAKCTYVNEIQILPEQQNRGIGARVLTGVLTAADRRGVPVELQVLHLSRARSLYERLGFRCHGQTDTHVRMRRAPTRAP